MHRIKEVREARGELSFGEFGRDLPFVPKRYFVVRDVPEGETRGEHAHRECHQFLVCVHGSVTLTVDDGYTTGDVVLDHPGIGVHIPPMIWGIQHHYSRDAALLVFASHYYDATDYIRDYDAYRAAAAPARESRQGQGPKS